MIHFSRGVAAIVAVALLSVFAVGQAPRPLDEREYLSGVQDATRRLVSEVEHIQEHLSDLRGMKERELYRRADNFLHQALHFQDSLRAGANRERLYRDFAAMDKELHGLVEALQPLAQNSRAIQRDLVSLTQADERLHFALSRGDAAPDRGMEVLHRQVHALAAEAGEFHRVVSHILAGDRNGAHTIESAAAFAKAADHLHRSLDRNATREHIQRDFAAVDRAWHHLVRHVNEFPAREYNFIRTRAQRLDALHDRLFSLLGTQGERQRIVIPFERRP